jgi:hypothetical protein
MLELHDLGVFRPASPAAMRLLTCSLTMRIGASARFT